MQDDNSSPYQPPESSVELIEEITTEASYFSTSTLKLAVMSICTFGLYDLYWFYKNWELIKAQTGENIMPFWRAFFAPFWAYSCFNHIKASANDADVPESLPVGLLAIVYFAIQALWRVPDPYWLISYLSFAPLIPANTLAVRINLKQNPNFTNNTRFSGWNWCGVVLGGSVFALGLLGTFMPEV